MRDAVRTLHVDQIKPSLSEISRRVAELSLGSFCPDQRMCMNYFSHADGYLYSACKKIVTFKDLPDWFRGFICPRTSDASIFAETYFSEFSTVLVAMLRYPLLFTSDSPDLQPFQFRGGRYAVARRLCLMVSFSDFFSLGKLCRFVQVCIDRGILAYENNLLQPPAACSALSTAIVSRLVDYEDPDFVSLSEFSSVLSRIVNEAGEEGVLLSTLKKRIFEEIGKSLKLPRLGCTKFLDLVLQERFACSIFRDRNHKVLLYPLHISEIPGFVRLR